MEKGYVYRAYPNVKQRELIKKTFGCKRFVYNYFLDVRKAHWENDKKNMTFFEMNKLLTPLKQEKDFLREPDKNAVTERPPRPRHRPHKLLFDGAQNERVQVRLSS